MEYKNVANWLTALAAALLLLTPSTVLGGQGDQDTGETEEVQEVTLEDMTVDSEETNAAETTANTEDTFQQRGDTGYPGSLAGTIGINALWGGITGALIGTGVWLLMRSDFDAWLIPQFAGGGILVGSVVGLATWLLYAEDEAREEAEQDSERVNSVDWVMRDAPEVHEFDLIRVGF